MLVYERVSLHSFWLNHAETHCCLDKSPENLAASIRVKSPRAPNSSPFLLDKLWKIPNFFLVRSIYIYIINPHVGQLISAVFVTKPIPRACSDCVQSSGAKPLRWAARGRGPPAGEMRRKAAKNWRVSHGKWRIPPGTMVDSEFTKDGCWMTGIFSSWGWMN